MNNILMMLGGIYVILCVLWFTAVIIHDAVSYLHEAIFVRPRIARRLRELRDE